MPDKVKLNYEHLETNESKQFEIDINDLEFAMSSYSSLYQYKIYEVKPSVVKALSESNFSDSLYTNKNFHLFLELDISAYANKEGVIDIWSCSETRISKDIFQEITKEQLLSKYFRTVTWGQTQSKTFGFKKNYLADQIRVRYAMMDRPSSGLSNVVLDSFIPRCLYKSNFNLEEAKEILNAPKTSVCISPWFASMFGIKQMEISQLCKILGYDKQDIKLLFDKVKAKQKSICFIGYGGTNVNTIHWLSELSKYTHSINVFKEVEVFEPEVAEISNLLRFPINPYSVNKTQTYSESNKNMHSKSLGSKLTMLEEQLTRLTYKNVSIKHSKLELKQDSSAYAMAYESTLNRINNERNYEHEVKDDWVIYGAPNISTRQTLSKYGNFISATHGDESCRLDLNPAQDAQLQVESYGIIQLSTFFMNQLRLAIGLLETLARNDIDFKAQDQTLLEYSFDGQAVNQTDRNYNFQLSHSGLVLTEEQAQNF